MIVLSSSSLLVLYGNNLLRNIHPESLQRIQRFGAKNRRSISTSGSTLSVKKAHKQPRKPASTATATAPGRSKQKPLLSASPARKPLNAEPTLLPGKDEDRRTNYPPLVAAARAKTVNQRSVFESYLVLSWKTRLYLWLGLGTFATLGLYVGDILVPEEGEEVEETNGII